MWLTLYGYSQVLSGSSDSTIKLWSTKTSRCLATYETHADSVWTLYSDHPQLNTFFAGSKDGLVTRTELGCNETGSGSGEDECVGIFKENGGVAKIVVLDDRYIWTATSSSSVNRWVSVLGQAAVEGLGEKRLEWKSRRWPDLIRFNSTDLFLLHLPYLLYSWAYHLNNPVPCCLDHCTILKYPIVQWYTFLHQKLHSQDH